MSKTHRKPFFLQQRKFGRIIESGDGQMLSGRLEILTNGDDVALDCSEVPHDRSRFVKCLPHS